MSKKRMLGGIFCVLMAVGGIASLFKPETDMGFTLGASLLFAVLAVLCFRKKKKGPSVEGKTPDINIVIASSAGGANNSDADEAALYKKLFYSHMNTLEGFSKQDIDRVYSLLAGTEEKIGGTAVQYTPEAVLDAEFADRAWNWPEMDEWEKTFRQDGRYPSGWNNWWTAPGLESLDITALCNMLTVDRIREILDSLAISYLAKSKKADLVALLEEKAVMRDVAKAMPEWENMNQERKRERSKARGRELLRLIGGRAGSQNIAQIFESVRRKVNLVLNNPGDEAYIKKALALNPNAVPPFFPGDRSRYS